jgi:hypothetical protein
MKAEENSSAFLVNIETLRSFLESEISNSQDVYAGTHIQLHQKLLGS